MSGRSQEEEMTAPSRDEDLELVKELIKDAPMIHIRDCYEICGLIGRLVKRIEKQEAMLDTAEDSIYHAKDKRLEEHLEVGRLKVEIESLKAENVELKEKAKIFAEHHERMMGLPKAECKECLEQARLLGMGGSREAALMAKLEMARKALNHISMFPCEIGELTGPLDCRHCFAREALRQIQG